MPRIDTKQMARTGRVSGLYFWRRYLAAGFLLATGWGPAAGTPAAPWLIAAGAGALAWTLAVVFFGGRWWVTREEVVQSQGVVSRHTSEIELGRLKDVQVEQSWIERLLGIGTVRASLGDDDPSRVILEGVRNPRAVAELIREPERTDSE